MFIRWKARRSRLVEAYDRTKQVQWNAYVVRSERDGRGRPRQKVVRFLASVHEVEARRDTDGRYSMDMLLQGVHRFWWLAVRNLDHLDLADEVRARLEKQLAARVPKLTAAERRTNEAFRKRSASFPGGATFLRHYARGLA